MIDYNIIATGSNGNAVVINSTILIDCGVPFKALKAVYKDLQLVVLTHRHTDHFNRAAIRKLAQERPVLRWGVPKWLVCGIMGLAEPKNIDVYEMDRAYGYADYVIRPFALTHNVPNAGYHIMFRQDERLIYATDTNSLNGIEARNYDLYMIEANYTEAEITERIRKKQEKGEYCHEWDVLKNHLSKEKADDWLYSDMGQNSQYVYLHEHSGETDY